MQISSISENCNLPDNDISLSNTFSNFAVLRILYYNILPTITKHDVNQKKNSYCHR